jgi:hypothetical protein
MDNGEVWKVVCVVAVCIVVVWVTVVTCWGGEIGPCRYGSEESETGGKKVIVSSPSPNLSGGSKDVRGSGCTEGVVWASQVGRTEVAVTSEEDRGG